MNPRTIYAGCGCAFGRITAALLVCWSLKVAAAGNQTNASSLSEEALLEIKFEQKLGNPVSLDLQFRDDGGRLVQLGDYFGRKPVILIMGYYECPMLCSLVLNGAVEALQDLRAKAGEDFQIVSISINPTETPELAAAKKRNFLKRYGRNDRGDAWHFLTGEQNAIQRVAGDVGFRYAYDERIKEYAHPSGLIVLTPAGKISHYLFGVGFSAKELDAALKEARREQIGSPIDQLLLLCFHYRPLTGKYGELVTMIVRASGVVTIAGLSWMVVALARRRQRESAREVRQ